MHACGWCVCVGVPLCVRVIVLAGGPVRGEVCLEARPTSRGGGNDDAAGTRTRKHTHVYLFTRARREGDAERATPIHTHPHIRADTHRCTHARTVERPQGWGTENEGVRGSGEENEEQRRCVWAEQPGKEEDKAGEAAWCFVRKQVCASAADRKAKRKLKKKKKKERKRERKKAGDIDD